MAQTENYGLSLCNDGTKKFKEWREEINGVTDSNMVKIDLILKSLESSLLTSAKTYNFVLDDWTEWDGYTPETECKIWHSILIDGLEKAKAVIVALSEDASDYQKKILKLFRIRSSSTFRPVYPGSSDVDMSNLLFFFSEKHTNGLPDGFSVPITVIVFS